MIATTNTRFAVRLTTAEGNVLMKDMASGHWTTYPVRDMTKAEAEAVVAQEVAKRTTSTHEIIDLEVEEAAAKIFKAVKDAYLEAVGYNEISKEDRWTEAAFAMRKAAIEVAKKARDLASEQIVLKA